MAYSFNPFTGSLDITFSGSSVPSFETDPLSLHLNQSTPQTFTNLGGSTGLMKVTSGLLGLDTNTYLTDAAGSIALDGKQYARKDAGWAEVVIPPGMVYPGAGIALSTGSAWDTSITDNSANWNTAYGWGNHASAGYALLDGTNQPFTGNLNVSKATPSLTLTSTDDANNTATLSRSATNRALTLKNYVGTPTNGPLALTSSIYVSTPSATFLNGATSFSISMWIKTTSYPSYWGWFESRSGAGLQGLYAGVLYINGNIVAQVGAPSNGVWHHIVGVWSSGTRGEIWVDGIKTTGSNYTGTMSNDHQFYFMVDPYALDGTRSVNGSIDEAAVWDRALTNGEIADLYNTGNGMYITGNFPSSATPVTTNLLALWHIDENTGLSLTDSSGNSNTGTAYTGSTWTTGAGTIQPAAGAQQGTILNYVDGANAGEKGIAYIGDASSRTVIQGLTTRFNVNGTEMGNLGSTMAWTLPNIITGSTDAIQLKVVGNATQTTNPFQITTSAAANIFSVSNAGVINVISGTSIRPSADGTAAINFATNGGTSIFDVDTTNSRIGIGLVAPAAKLHVLATTEQLRLGYDASNYLSATVASTGSTTFALTGTTPLFTFSQGIINSTLTASKPVYTNASKQLVSGSYSLPQIVASANLTGQTASVASVTTYTTPSDSTIHSFRVGCYTSITAITAGTLTITLTFTDENNTAQTITYFPMGLTSAGITTTGFTAFAPANIRCKDNTAITLVATFAGVSTTYDVGGTIESLY